MIDADNARDYRLAIRWIVLVILLGAVVNTIGIIHKARGAEHGTASIYGNGDGHAWSKTANGERVNPNALTAAHKSLPFNTRVRVTNKRNGRSVVLRISDRGPYVRRRIIDVTPAGARALGFAGLAAVTVEVVR